MVKWLGYLQEFKKGKKLVEMEKERVFIDLNNGDEEKDVDYK